MSSVTYGNESGDTAMSFEFGDDVSRMSAGEPMKMGLDFSSLFGRANSEAATEPATESPEQVGKSAEEIGDDADELSKALKSVTGLGESAAKAWGKLFGGDQAHNLSPFALFVL